jgi:transcriptional regulator with XRE-family HTH domain
MDELASASKVDKQTIWRLETGRSWPKYENVIAICGALNVNPAYLFDWQSIDPKTALAVLAEAIAAKPPAIPGRADKLTAELLDGFPQLDEVGRESVLSVLRHHLGQVQSKANRKA